MKTVRWNNAMKGEELKTNIYKDLPQTETISTKELDESQGGISASDIGIDNTVPKALIQ